MNKLVATTAIVAAALFTPSSAHGVVTRIIRPMSVTSSLGSASNLSVNNLINESGWL